MILRALVLVGGVMGGAASSQFPEYSQQYMQRLGGAVDALAQVVADFDASAQAVGLDRAAALEQMRGTPFLERRRADMALTFARHARLSDDLAALQGQGPFMRAYKLSHLADPEIGRAAWATYQPALPMNFAGMVFAIAGFIVAGMSVAVGLRLIRWPFRRRRNGMSMAA